MILYYLFVDDILDKHYLDDNMRFVGCVCVNIYIYIVRERERKRELRFVISSRYVRLSRALISLRPSVSSIKSILLIGSLTGIVQMAETRGTHTSLWKKG